MPLQFFLIPSAPSAPPAGSGAAVLAGSGTLSASGVASYTGSAVLAGAGSLSASGTFIAPGAGGATLSASGTLAATGTADAFGSATLAGLGGLDAAGAASYTAAATLGGAGDLTASGVASYVGSAVLAGVGGLSATGFVGTTGAAVLAAVGSLAASGTASYAGAAVLSGSGTLTATGTVSAAFGSAVLAGVGSLSARGLVGGVGRAVLGGTGSLTALGTASGPPPRDDRILIAIRDILEATDSFASVMIGTGPDDFAFSSELGSFALAWVDEWDETDDASSGDEPDIPHVGKYYLKVGVRDDDATLRAWRMGKLQSIAKDALDGVSLGGMTLPALTKLRKGRRDKSAGAPDAVWILEGEYQWIAEGFDGHDETDLELP